MQASQVPYGLKQSHCVCFSRFSKVLKTFGYFQEQTDNTLFIKQSENKITILIVYIDDIIVTGDVVAGKEMANIKLMTTRGFEVKDLGILNYFFGNGNFQKQGRDVCFLTEYILDLLDETEMLGCKPSNTPIELGTKIRCLKAKRG